MKFVTSVLTRLKASTGLGDPPIAFKLPRRVTKSVSFGISSVVELSRVKGICKINTLPSKTVFQAHMKPIYNLKLELLKAKKKLI